MTQFWFCFLPFYGIKYSRRIKEGCSMSQQRVCVTDPVQLLELHRLTAEQSKGPLISPSTSNSHQFSLPLPLPLFMVNTICFLFDKLHWHYKLNVFIQWIIRPVWYYCTWRNVQRADIHAVIMADRVRIYWFWVSYIIYRLHTGENRFHVGESHAQRHSYFYFLFDRRPIHAETNVQKRRLSKRRNVMWGNSVNGFDYWQRMRLERAG